MNNGEILKSVKMLKKTLINFCNDNVIDKTQILSKLKNLKFMFCIYSEKFTENNIKF